MHVGCDEVSKIPDPISRASDAKAKGQVFVVHEDVFGESPDPKSQRSSNHHEGAAQGLHIPAPLVIPASHHLVRENWVVREAYLKIERLPQEVTEPVVPARTLLLEPSIGVDQSAAHHRDLGIVLQLAQARRECPFAHDGVRIQEKDMAPSGQPQCLVVGSGKSHVLGVLYDADRGERLGNGLHRAV